MLRSTSQTNSASIRGLYTDGNDLAHLDQSNLSESNYELCRDGTRRRRRAVIEETTRPNHEGVENGSASTGYIWRTPNRLNEVSFLVEQRNGRIFFYDIQHNDPAYMRDRQVFQIDLGLFGEAHADEIQDLQFPCTYTEGNGALYIFHRTSGTIKVELQSSGIRVTPIGTWIRDYEGAAEVLDTDARFRLSVDGVPIDLTTYAPNQPFLDGPQLPLIGAIDEARYYNWSNTGWDAKGLAAFIDQSSEVYEVRDPLVKDGVFTQPARFLGAAIPALTDRYLSGRQIDEDGEETFSFKQLFEAKDNKSMPPMGSRVKHSALHPAGTLVGLPNNRTANITADQQDQEIRLEVEYTDNQLNSIGRPGETMAVFVHYLTYTVQDADGVTWTGGFSGVLDGERSFSLDDNNVISINANRLIGRYRNQYLSQNGFTNFQVTAAYIHPSPEYFPHQLPNNDARYDFRQERRPSSGAYYAGRLWQTGDEHNRIYYSQQLEAGSNSGDNRGVVRESQCYAAADPTDGFDNALVATDGGYINISDSGTHLGLVPWQDSLLVMTDNGIWSISPGQGGFFVADDFRVQKISNGEVLGIRSFAVVDNEVHVATDEGILAITTEGIRSLTDERIRIRYDEIVAEGREVLVNYDPETYVVRWAFPDAIAQTTIDSRLGVTMLSYHRLHEAWFQYDFPEDYSIVDMVVLPYTARVETYNKFRYLVVAKNFDVLQLGQPLSSEWGVEANLGPSGFDEWVEAHSQRFTDFLDSTGDPVNVREPMPAFMQTNHWTLGNAGKFTQIKYLIAHNKNVTTHTIEEDDGSLSPNIPGSTLVTAQWDWFDADHQNKFSKPHQTYRFRRSYFRDDAMYDRGEPNLVAKVKIRGRGREFRLLWEAEGQNDSHLNGWVLDGSVMGET